MKKINHSLMENNIEDSDVDSLRKFLNMNKKKIFTQSSQVKLFEKNWSKWLDCKYSIFVNSGSSANLLSILCLKILKGKGEIIVPTLTWISDIASVIQNGFKPVFVDINPKTLCMDETQVLNKINKRTKAVFLTHVQGFNGLTSKLLLELKKRKLPLIEDVCESHGATFKNKKLGTYGLISNFSFFYAHHLSTIEGGMVCTNNKKIYELIKMLRSHGMVRESGNVKFEKSMQKKFPDLSPKFIFIHPSYNLRNTELSATIGINQLKRLSKNNKLRNKNFRFFLKNLNSKFYQTDYNMDGISNYAFPLILKKKSINNRNLLESKMKEVKIEFRRGNAGGGNQIRQPYLLKIIKKSEIKKFPNVDHVHFFGYYIGNFPTLKLNKIKKICDFLNSINFTD